MNCEWTAKLDRYVDGELAGGELAEFQGHLVGCAACATGALGRLQLKRMTQAAAGQRYRPPAEFRLKIEQSARPPKAGRWAKQRWPTLALAAMLLLTVASSLLWVQSSRGEQGVSELADLHVATLASANPVDVVSTDRHTVKPWFQGKLPFTFNLPELQNTPFRLLGGKVAYFHQRAGAQLLYAVGKHEISLRELF